MTIKSITIRFQAIIEIFGAMFCKQQPSKEPLDNNTRNDDDGDHYDTDDNDHNARKS
jgi:hypothetical protein